MKKKCYCFVLVFDVLVKMNCDCFVLVVCAVLVRILDLVKMKCYCFVLVVCAVLVQMMKTHGVNGVWDELVVHIGEILENTWVGEMLVKLGNPVFWGCPGDPMSLK